MTERESRVSRSLHALRQRLWGRPRDWISPRRKRFWAVVVVLLYTVAGFFLVPWIAQRQVVQIVGETFARPVRLDDVNVNPFVLSVEALGFAITETDGSPIVGFDRLYANFQLSSLLRWAWTFREVTLEAPQVTFVRFENGRTNLGRMLSTGAGEPAAEEAGGLPRLIVQTFNLLQGAGEFTDRVPETDFNAPFGPVNVTVSNISTLPDASGQQHVEVHTERGANLAWQGTLRVDPLHSAGRFTASGPFVPLTYRYFQDVLLLDAAEGELVVAVDYEVALDEAGTISATLSDLDLALRDLRLVQDARDLLTLPEIRLQGGRVAYPQQTVAFERFSITGPAVLLWLYPDGTPNVERIVAAAPGPQASPASSPAPAAAPAGAPEADAGGGEAGALDEWTLSLARFELSDLALTFEDQTLTEPGQLRLTELDLALESLSNAPDARFPLSASLAIAPGGRISLEGDVGALPAPLLEAALMIDGLELAALQPYVTEVAALRIDGGALSARADLKVDADEPFGASGKLALTGLAVEDLLKEERLVGWHELAVDRFDYSTADAVLGVSEVVLDEPYVRLLIAEDRTTNFDQVLKSAEGAPAADEAPADATEEAATTLPLAVTVGRVRMQSGAADFTDLALPLPFQSSISKLEGELTTLDTASSQPSKLRLEGQVADYGLARIQGSLMPLGPTRQTDVNVLFRNVALPDLTPYTIRFAGREIDDGRMEVELHYRVNDGRMQGANSVVISDLALGQKVEHPDAFDLPLGLAVALLKGPDGRIDLDVPVEGDVDDPQFRIGGVIMKAVANIITNIVTSPFRLLGSLVGIDSEEFGQLEFEPGSGGLTPPEREKLHKLAEALTLRPQLALEVGGVFDPEADRQALKTRAVRQRIATLLAAPEDDEPMLSARRREAVESLFDEAFPDTPLEDVQAGFQQPQDPADPQSDAVLDETAYVAELERRLIEQEPIGDAELQALAEQRVATTIEVLTEGSEVDPGRVQVGDPEGVEATDDGWIRMQLEVQAAG